MSDTQKTGDRIAKVIARALRDAPPPDLEKVHTWVQRARAVKAAA